MKMVSQLSLLALAILLASCNEQVSPELQNSNSTVPDNSTPVAPDEFYFSVANSSPVILNYKLHQTGLGNANKSCEIRNTTGFSNDIFVADRTSNDITCFFEAEELALYFNGLEMEMKASKNTCDYVAYTPFGYYDRIPGNSSATYSLITCGESVSDADAHTALGGTMASLRYGAGATNLNCNEYLVGSSYISALNRLPISTDNEQDFCAFDYSSSEGPNCDIGEIYIDEYTIAFDDSDPPVPKATRMPTRKVKCGGKVTNCVAGPTKKMRPDRTSFTEITNTVLNQEVSVKYNYEGLIGKRTSVKSYANYRRNLANTDIDFGQSITAGTINLSRSLWDLDATYVSSWTNETTFNPEVLEYFSKNLMLDGTTNLVSSSELTTEATRNRQIYRYPLAPDPYIGLGGRVNPFYTFYCLDNALDIKARIRIMVREWDRIFPSSSAYREKLSDLDESSPNRYQDRPRDEEVPGDVLGAFNDLDDWDDLIPMKREPGLTPPTSTVWRPQPTATYINGWFNPSFFPYEEEED